MEAIWQKKSTELIWREYSNDALHIFTFSFFHHNPVWIERYFQKIFKKWEEKQVREKERERWENTELRYRLDWKTHCFVTG